MIALELEWIAFFVVSVDGQDFSGALINSDDVRQSDSVLIFKAGQVIVDLDFAELVAVVVCQAVTLLVGLLFLHIRVGLDRLAQLNVPVKACNLQLLYVVLCLAHNVSHTLCCTCSRRAIRDDHVFSRDKYRGLASQAGIVVDLLER